MLSQRVIEQFEEVLDRDQPELRSDLAAMIQVNMADYVDRFVSALAADAILPMDF